MATYRDENDDKLVARWQAGDDDAFSELIEKYRGRLNKYCSNFIHNNSDIEEAISEMSITLLKKNEVIKNGGHFKSYAFQVARHRCIDIIRKGKLVEVGGEEGMPERGEDDPNITRIVEKAFLDCVEAHLNQSLNEREYAIFRYRKLAGLTVRAIVEQMPQETTEKIRWALQKIGKALDDAKQHCE